VGVAKRGRTSSRTGSSASLSPTTGSFTGGRHVVARMALLSGVARRLAALADAAEAAAGSLLPVDANPVPGRWSHVTKVDPEPARRLPLLYPLYLQQTDAVAVGGSSDVTPKSTVATFDLLSYARTPAFHEPSDPAHVTAETRERAALIAIPEVLNGDVDALVGDLGAGVERLRGELVPELLAARLPDAVVDRVGDPLAEYLTNLLLRRAVFEAYVVNNPDSAAAERAGVGPGDVLGPAAARQRAMAADRHLGSEVVYLEYSGTDGGEAAREVLRALDGSLARARVWYGGGLDAREPAAAMLEAGADAVVVGNAFHAVAEEEARRRAAAREALAPGADHETVEQWVRDRGPPGETAAAGYLATNPAVDAPADRAGEYLAAAVGADLSARALADGADQAPPTDPDAFADWAREAAPGPLPAEQAVATALPRDRDAEAFALALTATLLGVPDAATLPVAHLADAG
jgi:phosphoglycerol geranylgeranyltransferase